MSCKIFLVFLISSLLFSCAGSSGVSKMGPDTYTLSAKASFFRGGTGTAKKIAIDEANLYCSNLEKEILVQNISSEVDEHGHGYVDLTFQCLYGSDPDLGRPTYKNVPDVIIEDRRN